MVRMANRALQELRVPPDRKVRRDSRGLLGQPGNRGPGASRGQLALKDRKARKAPRVSRARKATRAPHS